MIAFLYARVSVVKESMEVPRTKLHVPHGVGDILVTQVLLNEPQVGSTFSQVVTARMPEAVGMNMQFTKSCAHRDPVKHELDRARAESPASLRSKDEFWRHRTFLPQSPQGSDFHPAQAMIARQGALEASDMENPLLEIELLPAGLQALRNAQSVREEDKDQGRVAKAVSITSSALNQLIDLPFEQMLSGSSPAANCSPYGDWNHISHACKTCAKSAYRIVD